MAKDKNIHIRIELGRDKTSGNLALLTYFDQNAPNFSKDEDGYFWLPTVEEKNFLNEAFELIPTARSKTPTPSYEKTVTTPPVPPKPQTSTEDKKPETLPLPEETITETPEKEEKTPSLFGHKDEKKPTDLPSLEKKEETVFEVTEEEPKPDSQEKADEETKEEKNEKKILVEANDQAIERALKKDEEKDETLVEVDEQTIIDKVLSQKKKGRWNRGR